MMRVGKVTRRTIIQVANEIGVVNDGEALYTRQYVAGIIDEGGGHLNCKDISTRIFLRFVKRAFPFLLWKLARCTRCHKRHLLWRSPVKYSRWVCGCVEMDWSDYTWILSKEKDKAQTTLEVGDCVDEKSTTDNDRKRTTDSE